MSAVGWPELHARLEKARLTVAQAATPTPEEQLRILRSRARALARQRKDERTAEDGVDVVAFGLAGESYAVEAACVREVYPLKALAPLPGTPPFVRGMVHLRGRIVAVIDLRRFFDLPDKGLSDLNKLIVLGSGSTTFAILADAIQGIQRLALAELQPGLPGGHAVGSDYVRGMNRDGLVVLAAERLLSDPKLLIEQKPEI